VGYETIEFEVRDAVAHVTLNRPDAANALDLALAGDLRDAAQACERDPAVRAVLLAANGKMFCAGGDLKDFASAPEGIPAFVRKVADTFHEALLVLARMNAPVVAAVQGAAAGAGMSLACAADVAIAGESAKFTMAYTAAGLTPDGSSTWVLPRVIGQLRALELMLTNRRLSAAEAAEWNLINRVVPDADLAAEAEKLARTLAAGPTRAYGAVKKLLAASADNDLATQLGLETDSIAAMAGTRDGEEGIRAFLEKRAPGFTGE